MFLFQRNINTDGGWEFIAAAGNTPRTLLNPFEQYNYFFITTEIC